jgi:hypothetical protein
MGERQPLCLYRTEPHGDVTGLTEQDFSRLAEGAERHVNAERNVEQQWPP